MTSNKRLLALSLLLGALGLGLGFYAGRASSPLEEPTNASAPKTDAEARSALYSSYPNVQDAMRRWAAKDGLTVEKAMRGRSIEIMHFPDRDCIQFNIELGAVGGVPIYCYRVDASDPMPRSTTDLIFEHSDVE